jgi:hypothetical protein
MIDFELNRMAEDCDWQTGINNTIKQIVADKAGEILAVGLSNLLNVNGINR